jgi:hypothetical protein
LYSAISDCFTKHKILRLILHPDTFSTKLSRRQQLAFLSDSLSNLEENIHSIDFICIEPRGTDRQKKIMRLEIEDIQRLDEYLQANGTRNIGLCIDIAQLFIVHGNEGILSFLEDLKSIHLPIKEFHISDVITNEKTKNRVAMEVGTGGIDWKLILPLILQHCNELLIETLGGVKVFQRSTSYLESLLM